ncbi:MarP family serine protease [Corynebacterium sp.]|uniref:MarP family serine protease n=1 Tax=Corynebacterium sp. TaxID=1720 RepID=UPI002649057C|nr:MarP family serine protease [Corynebacterium sp.]MDN6137833.1 MarP family serine protease [Corynebacterium sp.]MDN6738021.1 MarP family serine protease [Corynebacterium sp.]
MDPAWIVDGFIVVAVLAAMTSGWRQGGLASLLSAVGILAGLIIGLGVAPLVLQITDQVGIRFLLALGMLILLIGLGQLLGSALGHAIRDRMKTKSGQRVDSSFGAVLMSVFSLVLIWLIATPMATSLSNSVGKGVRESAILREVNKVMPDELTQLPRSISGMLNDSGLPPVMMPWEDGTSVDVEAPNIEVADQAMVQDVRPSVVHVIADADGCRRRMMGSGFVTADNYVVTNAHVVAGTQTAYVDTVLGIKAARVVYYNPEVDIAVLRAENLGLEPLAWADGPAYTGDDAVVMGFPHSGPFTANAARIRERVNIAGPDIYSNSRVERESYILRGTVVQGNSGGPLISPNGTVLGLIFGASVDDTDTGYAITAEEVRAHVGDVTRFENSVDTQECVAQ